jgi:serine/arginine repetitive matrix protein 2
MPTPHRSSRAGIGLLTPRGSGTSGYVTGNKFNLRGPPPQQRREDEDRGPTQRKPNADILEHNRKREVELEVEVMRAQLEDDGCAYAPARSWTCSQARSGRLSALGEPWARPAPAAARRALTPLSSLPCAARGQVG